MGWNRHLFINDRDLKNKNGVFLYDKLTLDLINPKRKLIAKTRRPGDLNQFIDKFNKGEENIIVISKKEQTIRRPYNLHGKNLCLELILPGHGRGDNKKTVWFLALYKVGINTCAKILLHEITEIARITTLPEKTKFDKQGIAIAAHCEDSRCYASLNGAKVEECINVPIAFIELIGETPLKRIIPKTIKDHYTRILTRHLSKVVSKRGMECFRQKTYLCGECKESLETYLKLSL